jgi:hypothetical protein
MGGDKGDSNSTVMETLLKFITIDKLGVIYRTQRYHRQKHRRQSKE